MFTFACKRVKAMELKKVALNQVHESLNAKMVPFAGFNMPVRYTSDIEEHKAVRENVGVFDVSHMGEFFVEGNQALDLIQLVSSNDASKLIDGQAQYSYLPNDKGGIVDDFLVYRFHDKKYLLVVNASNIEKDWNWINQHNTFDAKLTNASDDYSLLAVQGPKATQTLQKLTEINLSEVKFYHFVEGNLAGIPNIIISATGYTGAGGFELYIKNENAQDVWGAVFEAGKDQNIKPIGLGARDTLRLEMGYCLYGNDITDETSPIAAGLGWVTKFTKDFINASQLKAVKEQGTTQKLVGFKMLDRGIPRSHYEVFDADDNKIGEVSSGSMSPSLGYGIGLAYVNKPFHISGSEIYIGVRNRRLKAQVEKLPLFKA